MDQGEDRERVIRSPEPYSLLDAIAAYEDDAAKRKGKAGMLVQPETSEDALNATVGRPGHWTPDPPTEPGFYWVREPSLRGHLGTPRVEELKSGLWWTPGSDASADDDELDGWLFWSERLEPPEEA